MLPINLQVIKTVITEPSLCSLKWRNYKEINHDMMICTFTKLGEGLCNVSVDYYIFLINIEVKFLKHYILGRFWWSFG